jgi:hypothetical protein
MVADDHVNARLATATIWSLDEDWTYTLPVFREKYTWSDEAIPERLRYLATHLHGSDTAVRKRAPSKCSRRLRSGRLQAGSSGSVMTTSTTPPGEERKSSRRPIR